MSNPELLTRHLAVKIFDAVFRHGKGLEEEYAACMDYQEKKRHL